MSNRYPGGVVRKNQLVPTTSSASGMWTVEQSAQATKSDIWPYSGIANPISQSLRIRRANSAYLQRTPATQTNRSTWTYSFWHKRGSYNGNSQSWITAGTGGNIDSFTLNSNDKISIDINNATRLVSTQVFRDPSAWYHFVWYYDATQGTASNRMKVYVNGVEITAFDTDTRSSISSATSITNTTVAHRIGYYDAGILYTDGYMADVNFIDGQALDPSYFGQTSAITGVWEPKQYSGTYGTNGWHLEFKDTTVGQDTSGNNNDWTPNNISTTLGSTYDLMVDVPTQWAPRNTTDVGGVVRGNYATLNPLNKGSAVTLINGNLGLTQSASWNGVTGTTGVSSGKWYFELTYGGGTACVVGVATPTYDVTTEPGDGATTVWRYRSDDGTKKNGGSGSGSAYGATWTTNDVIGVALDMDSGTITFYKNNSSQGTAYSNLANNTVVPVVGIYSSSGTTSLNFGQRPFTYTPPSGFKSLCTTNLPTPTIGATVATAANKYFDATLYTGTGSSNPITNAGAFQPDFVWLKNRGTTGNWPMHDAIRGAGQQIASNNTNDEVPGGTEFTSFNSNGFTVASTAGSYNASTNTYVAYQWNAGNANTTNTTGSITAIVRANPTSGFSIATFTGNGTAGATVGHGLGVAPSMILFKGRSTGTSGLVWHTGYGTNQGQMLIDSTAAIYNPGNGLYFNSTYPSSTVVTLGTSGATNGNGQTYVLYSWAPVAGYSAFGTYTGNGSSNGPFVYTGFRPKYVLFKCTTNGENWYISDSARQTYNGSVNPFLKPNTNEAEDNTYAFCNIFSNGFQLRYPGSETNGSGRTYIYAAWAEHPFKNSLAR
jgi:hypothetical protein